MGLNRPFLIRYSSWLRQLVQGNLGLSYQDNLPVADKLAAGLRYTLPLAAGSLLLSVIVSIPLAVITAVYRNTVFHSLTKLLCAIGNAIPNFLVSVLLLYVLGIKLKLFPIIANESVNGLILPILALSLPLTSRFLIQFQAEILDQLDKEYVIGIQMRGVTACRVLFSNILHNSLPSILTIIGLSVGTLMGGSVVIETIFMWPGLGKLVMDSITARDDPVILGFVLIMTVIYVIINLLTITCSSRFSKRTHTACCCSSL